MPQRVRYRGKLEAPIVGQTFTKNANCAQSAWTSVWSGTMYATGRLERTADTITPGFHKKRAEGGVYFNPYSHTLDEWSHELGADLEYTRTSSFITCSGQNRYYSVRQDKGMFDYYHAACYNKVVGTPDVRPAVPAIFTDREISDVVVETSTKVNNDRGRADFNLWETLAEADKALGTLTGVFKNARKILREDSLKALNREGSSAYLAWRYGIKPLISDVGNVIEGLDKKVGRRRKSTRSKEVLVKYENRTPTKSYTDIVIRFNEAITDKVTVRAMSLDEHVVDLAYNLGLTSKGLITLPWELVKRSFILDWFVNVGDFIGALTPTFGWTNLGSCVVVKREKLMHISNAGVLAQTGYVIDSQWSGNYKASQSSAYRYTGLASPGLIIKSDFRFSNLTRCLDAYALLAQQVFK